MCKIIHLCGDGFSIFDSLKKFELLVAIFRVLLGMAGELKGEASG